MSFLGLLSVLRLMTLRLMTHPDAALVAVLAGILLLYAEFNVPGTVLPGCLGALSLMLGVFGLSRMPLRPSALALILAASALILLAIARQRPLLPGAFGVAILAAGFLRLVDATRYGAPVRPAAALLGAFTFGTATLCLGRIALLARRNKQLPRPATGARRVD